MSTIIVPGGTSGIGLNIVNTGINLVILYFVYKIVREYLANLAINKPINVVDVFKSINVDIRGLFAPRPTQDNQPPVY